MAVVVVGVWVVMIPFTPTAEELPRLLDGSQTLIVRAVEPQPYAGTCATGIDFDGVCYFFDRPTCGAPAECDEPQRCPLGAPGGVVFCQEEYAYPALPRGWLRKEGRYTPKVIFATASEETQNQWSFGEWKPADTMPEWAARLCLRIISADCRRVQTVTEEEAIDAGFRPCSMAGGKLEASAREMLIASLDDDDTNPWAWFVQVERRERP